jgi:signal transduction histidine kinase
MYAGEAEVWHQAERGIARIDADIDSIVGAVKRDDIRSAREGQDRLDSSSEAVARALSNAIDVNVAAATRLAAEIGDSRRAGIRWTILLDGIGVAFASLAAALVLRISRAHSRAVQAYRHIAEERAEELEQFAGRMAHDVRTPLATIGLCVGVAEKQGGDNPRFRRAITRANAAFAQATEIIDALFEFARSGARPDPGARACVAEAAEDTAAVLQTRADEIGADIIVNSTSRSLVPCTTGVLDSVLGNLVGNALTYVDGATTRSVTIDIADEAQEVKTTISDTGPGLPSGADPGALFQPYVRGEGARGRGMGLGLATVKRIVEAHGGKVGVRSSSRGCAFWFTLPRLECS